MLKLKKRIKMLTDNKQFYSTGEVAKIFCCSRVAVFQWIQTGKINAIKTLGGHYRIPKKDIEKIIKKSNSSLKNRKPKEKKTRILVVDDEEQIVKTLTLFLEKINPNFEVYGTTNSFDAGRLVITFKPDIAIIDIIMPGMDGFEVCEKIKSDPLTKNIKIIAITGYGTKETIEKIKRKGASVCILKPFDYYEVAEEVRKLAHDKNE